MFSLEPDLTERYNDGLEPPPVFTTAAQAHLRPLVWQPASAQVESAKKQLIWSAVIFAFCFIGLVMAIGWFLQ